jgi:hypothetical protein
MKVCRIRMVVMLLLGFGLLSGLDAPPARADFTFGQPVDVHSDFPYVSPADEWTDCFSADGLEVYFESWGGPTWRVRRARHLGIQTSLGRGRLGRSGESRASCQ